MNRPNSFRRLASVSQFLADVIRQRQLRDLVWPVSAVVLFALALMPLSMAAPEPAATAPAPQPTLIPVQSTAFPVSSTIVEVHRTRMIAFSIPAPAEADTRPPVELRSDDGIERVRVVSDAEVLAGHSTGFIRVRGLVPGTARLRVGSSSIELHIVEPRSDRAERAATPRITQPLSGAFLWGSFAVGVEWTDEPTEPREAPRLTVTTANGTVHQLEPSDVTPAAEGVARRAVFLLEPGMLSPGIVEMRASNADPTGRSHAGPRVAVRYAELSGEQVMSIEAEELRSAPRPGRFADIRGDARVVDDSAASGGRAVVYSNANPPLCWTFQLDQGGMYQMVVTASGQAHAGVMPSIAFYVDGAQNPATSGRVVHTGYHRVAVGVPVRLNGPWVTVTPRFENPFSGGGRERQLRIDRIELVRVDAAGSEAEAAPGGMSGMMADQPAGMAGMSGMDSPMAEGMGAMGETSGRTSTSGRYSTSALQNDDPYGEANFPIRVGLSRVVEGLHVTGPLELDVVLNWAGRDRGNAPPPVTSLIVNGREVSRQRSAAPRFWLDPSLLRSGENSLILVARADDGTIARSPEQRVILPDTASASASPLAFFRFPVHAEQWDSAAAALVRNDNNARERRRMAIFTGIPAALTLPAPVQGTYRVLVECRGATARGLPDLLATLNVPGADPAPAGKAATRSYNDTIDLGTITIPPRVPGADPTRLVLHIDREGYADRRREPGVLLDAVILQQVATEPSPARGHGSWTRVVWPPAEAGSTPERPHVAFEQDVLVVDVYSPAGPTRAELLIDGRATGLSFDVTRSAGPVVLPVIGRGLEGSDRWISARVHFADGSALETERRAVRFLSEPPSLATAYERAVTLLDRFGFGPSPQDLAAVLRLGEEAWLRTRLTGESASRADLAALATASAQFTNRRSAEDIANRAIVQAALTSAPARARLHLWTQNHFNTWIRKTDPDRKWSEHMDFIRHADGSFLDLLLTSASSPAMVVYLDQARSFRGRLNENYAREIMELHTVGVKAGYTQQDVTALARAFTGWTAPLMAQGDALNDGEMRTWEFRFEPRLHDPAPLTVFGLRLPGLPETRGAGAAAAPLAAFDRVRASIEMLAARPETAAFIARKIAESFVSETPPERLVGDLAAVFMSTDGDLAEVLVALARHPDFWAGQEGLPVPRLTHPLEYALRLHRAALDARWTAPNAAGINAFLRRSRVGMFDWATPDGMPRADSAYADSNAMLQRWRLARDLSGSLANLVPNPWRYGADPTPEGWEERVIDLLAVRLTGRILTPESHAAALELLRAAEGTRDERTREAAAIVAAMPEANLR